jgi:ankyrin repeat protein
MTFQLNLEQLRKQAKERLRERRAARQEVKLADAQLEIARELGFASWPKLKAYVERLSLEQPFHTDLGYYEGRANGIASVTGVSVADARTDLAARHGFSSWRQLRHHVEAMQTGEEPPTPFVLAYRALENDDREGLLELLDRFPDLVLQRGTNGNDLLGMAGDPAIVSLLLERGADPNRGNDYGWTKLHQAGYSNDCDLARLMLGAGARTDLFARGDGGTPLVAALFWGHREVAELLGREPRNLRVAAGLGDVELIRRLAGTPQAGAHRGFYRPHGGFAAWQPSDDPQEVVDEALVWAAKAGRIEAIRLLVDLGARVDADPYRGTPLTWAAANGAVPTRSARWSSSGPTRTSAARSAGRATAKASPRSTSPHNQDDAKPWSRSSTSEPTRSSSTTCTAETRSAGRASAATKTCRTCFPDYPSTFLSAEGSRPVSARRTRVRWL